MSFIRSILKSRSRTTSAKKDGAEVIESHLSTSLKQPVSRTELLKANVSAVVTCDSPSKPKTETPQNQCLTLPSITNSPTAALESPGTDQSSDQASSGVAETFESQTSSSEKRHILHLPSELILHMTTFLPFNALLSLRSTCSTLHTILSPSQVTTHLATITSALLATERTALQEVWSRFYGAFEWQLQERPSKPLTCYGCLESKPLHCFVERMSSRGTGLGGKLAKSRRCKECMRRFYESEGCWWREHRVRKSEHRKRRSRADRVVRWVTRGDSLVETVGKGKEVGVCACCGNWRDELWWGCAKCFEEEEKRGRKLWDEAFGMYRARSPTGLKGWLFDRAGVWRSKRAARQRRRQTRRMEEGRWHRRLWRSTRRGGVLRWEGSWEGRVEALVELLQGSGTGRYTTAKDNSSYRLLDARKDNADTSERDEKEEWRPLDQVPLKKDRREVRCSYCWIPRKENVIIMLGLAWETDMPFEQWCADCQGEHVERREKRKLIKEARVPSLGGCRGAETVTGEEDILEDVQRLFV